jgi:hypothetical protein
LVDFARQVWDEVTPDAQRRQGEMLGAAADAAGQDLEGLAGMIGQSERTRLMAGIAMTGAARSAWPPKVYGLGRALADGLIAADEAQINLADLVLPAMTDMDRPHVSLLELLVRWIPDQVVGQPLGLRAHEELPYAPGEAWHVGQRAWTASQIGDVRPALRPAVTSLIGTLLRHGLAAQNDNIPGVLTKYAEEINKHLGSEYSSRMSEPTIRRIVPPPSWSPTELGERVLGYYRLAADEFAATHALAPGSDTSGTSDTG